MQSHTIATYAGVSTEEARRALADLEEVVRILGEHGPLTITDAAALFDTTLEDAHHLLTLAWARHDADFDVDSGRWQATGRPWW